MIRLCMALAAAALIGCTSTAAAAAGKKCNEAYNKRLAKLEDDHSMAQEGTLRYPGNQWEAIGGSLYYKRDYCLLKKTTLKKELDLIQYNKANVHCLTEFAKSLLSDKIKSHRQEMIDYREDCGRHKL